MEKEKKLIKDKKAFNKNLHAWYHEYHRKLPWRERPSVYKTVVSEFMLQQTQVDTVLPYFAKWLEIFPNFEKLAAATEELVMKQWEGLGYYSRAKNLHKLAKMVVELKKELPRSAKEWEAFPGVGPYTAAAIGSIGFGDKAAVVDGNVIRILTRLTANRKGFKDNRSAVKALKGLAEDLLHEGDPNLHNQAVMELGATVCYRVNPLCTVCPVVNFCEGAKIGDPEQYPKLASKKIEKVVLERVWLEKEKRLLLHRIPGTAKRLANMYELPMAEGLVERLREENLWVTKKRGISNQRIQEKIYKVDPCEIKAECFEDLHWIEKQRLDKLTLSGPHRKWINELMEQSSSETN